MTTAKVTELVVIAQNWMAARDNLVKLAGATSLVQVHANNSDFIKTMDAHSARFRQVLAPYLSSPELWEAFCEMAYVTKNNLPR